MVNAAGLSRFFSLRLPLRVEINVAQTAAVATLILNEIRQHLAVGFRLAKRWEFQPRNPIENNTSALMYYRTLPALQPPSAHQTPQPFKFLKTFKRVYPSAL